MRLLTLAEAFSRCLLRRLVSRPARAPFVAGSAVALAVLVPFLLVRGGERAGSALASAVADRAAARMLLLPLWAGAAAAGAVVTLLVPDGAALDPQLRAAPVTRARLVAVSALAPVAVLAVGLAALVLFAAVPLAGQLGGGRVSALVLLAAAAAACAVGAALAEAALAAWRGAPQAALGLAVPAAALAAAPLEPAAQALLGPDTARAALLRTSSLWLVASAAWIALLLLRPLPRAPRERRPLLPVPRGPALAWLVTALGRYARRGELRRAGTAAVVFGLLAAGATAAAGSSGATVVALAAVTALLGACAFPLAQHGLDLQARWLWLATRGRPGGAPAGGAAAAALLAAAVVATAALGALLFSGGVGALGGLALMTSVAIALAVLTGALLPWRGDRLSDQLATFGLFAGLGLCTSFVVGATAGRLLMVVPDAVLAAGVVAVPLAAALLLAGRSFGRLG